MAKTSSQYDSTGCGVLSSFDLTSSRKRPALVIADPDASTESNCVEFTPHDTVDRGSPLKIGGYAAPTAPTAVGAADRVNAWFNLNGELATVAQREPGVIYDNGRQDLWTTWQSSAINNTNVVVKSGIGGLRHKIISASFACISFTTAGTVLIWDGYTTAMYPARVGGVGSWWVTNSPNLLYGTGVGYNLFFTFDGNASFVFSLTGWTAP